MKKNNRRKIKKQLSKFRRQIISDFLRRSRWQRTKSLRHVSHYETMCLC
jgi:hypothetical protein